MVYTFSVVRLSEIIFVFVNSNEYSYSTLSQTKSIRKQLGFSCQPSNLNGSKLNTTPSLLRCESKIILQQKLIAFRIFDLPEAFGPNKPRDFKTGTPFQSITLCLNSRASLVFILAARKSILILSLMEKKFSNSIFSIIRTSIL